jgi:hypothetical protein
MNLEYSEQLVGIGDVSSQLAKLPRSLDFLARTFSSFRSCIHISIQLLHLDLCSGYAFGPCITLTQSHIAATYGFKD